MDHNNVRARVGASDYHCEQAGYLEPRRTEQESDTAGDTDGGNRMGRLNDHSEPSASPTRSALRQLAVLSLAVFVAVTIFAGVGAIGTERATDVTERSPIGSPRRHE